MKKKASLLFSVMTSGLLLLSMAANAEDFDQNEVDPADLTKVSSSIILGMSNQGDVKLQGSLAGNYSSGNGFMVLAEANIDEDGDYTNSRFQYFHTTDTNYSRMPKAAGSVDIIDNELFSSVALGGITLIPSPWENIMFFPQIAYVHGQLDDDFSRSNGNINRNLNGGMAAFYTSVRVDSAGTFFTFWPEYTYLDGDAEIKSKKFIINSGTPLSEHRDKWLMVKIEHSDTDIKVNNINLSSGSDTVAWFNFRMFF